MHKKHLRYLLRKERPLIEDEKSAMQDSTCGNCSFYVTDGIKKTFGRCYFNPPHMIVKKQLGEGGAIKESVKTTRPIVYPGDYCGHYEEPTMDDTRREDLEERTRRSYAEHSAR